MHELNDLEIELKKIKGQINSIYYKIKKSRNWSYSEVNQLRTLNARLVNIKIQIIKSRSKKP